MVVFNNTYFEIRVYKIAKMRVKGINTIETLICCGVILPSLPDAAVKIQCRGKADRGSYHKFGTSSVMN
jgi:hypothetical protein